MRYIAAIGWIFFVSSASAQQATPQVRLALPDRPAKATTGSQFADTIRDLPLAEREAAILKEITSGNVPEFLRRR